ncbi:MAG: PEP-CTERM sorting domain-containing protein [Phycisphaerales bacterium]|nr:PEP-CTERM sorting domain-containing protein [Phycisphaerales bacterium]
MKNTCLISTIAFAAIAAGASADVTYTFDSLTLDALEFNQIFGAGTLVGSLTGVRVNATLLDSVRTYANDLTIYIDLPPIGNGALQVGGYSTLGSTQRYWWSNGNDSAAGTVVNSTVNLATAIGFTGTAADLPVLLGNGFSGGGAMGTWTGSITLIGVNAVPAPGAIALLGLAGLAAGRRRRA